MKQPDGTLSRYTTGARLNHWLNAIVLILLALSGLALFHPSLYFLTGLFGGGVWTRILHPWMGLVLILTFAGLFFRFWRYNIWNPTDTQWLNRIRDVLAARDENLPEVGRYNAGQKLVFWLMTIAIVALFASGIVLWESQFGEAFTIMQKRLAAVVHAGSAVVILGVFILHVYAAIWVKGTVRAMMRGSVTGGWAWRHHRKWLREEAAKPKLAGE
jgi:formate dehydrogenase subunit gamma